MCDGCRPRFAPRPLAGPGEPPLYGGRPTDAALAGLVAAWKYHGARGATDVLGGLAAAALERAAAALGTPDVLVPVPLHRSRRRERGFNQAELLARAAAGGLPVRTDVLSRRRATPQQAKLAGDAAERAANVAGCFVAAPPAGPRARVVLVDDIITSGATVGEAAAALAAAGWRPVAAVAAGLSGGHGGASATPP